MDEVYFRKVSTTVIMAILVVLSFLLLRPILLSIIVGIILSFIFSPLYSWLYKKTKLKNLPVILICLVLIALIILPLWFFTPFLIDQSIKLYRASQELDIVTPLKNIFPSLFASQDFSTEIGSIIQSFITKTANSLMNYFSNILLEFPIIMLHIFVVFCTFFFVLRDKNEIIEYIKSLLPFSKEVEKKLFESTKQITYSVLYGQIILGGIQGVILGIGLFLFGVPNALLLSVLGLIAGILPIIGPSIVGVPVAIFLLIGGNYFSAFGIILFTIASSWSDTLLRPILVSKKIKLNTGIVLIGMIGGFLLFGVLGFILGPLILAYLIIIFEIYRSKDSSGILLQEQSNK